MHSAQHNTTAIYLCVIRMCALYNVSNFILAPQTAEVVKNATPTHRLGDRDGW